MLLKRKLTLLSLLTLAAILCSAATVQSFFPPEAMEQRLPPVEKQYTSFETAAYILKDRKGYVAVYASKDGRLLQQTSIPVSSLRQGDQALLRSGITADSRETLLMLLEDFNS